MAFEDRSSPNTTTNEATTTLNSPNSPESSRTSPYTCMTIQSHHRNVQTPSTSPSVNNAHQSRPFFRITTFALGMEKSQKRDESSPVRFRSNSPSTESLNSRSSPVLVQGQQPNQPAAIQTLKYSIRNILQPDFGRSAVQGLRQVSPAPPKHSKLISFKPYESKVEDGEKIAPLGSLSEAVKQIGVQNNEESPDSGASTPLPNPEDIKKDNDGNVPTLWPAWVYCTRYSDRPSSGPRSRRMKKAPTAKPAAAEDKRPRTAFSSAQLARLKHEFNENRYLTERRRQQLSAELGLNEAQIKIWFQNKRAKIKKSSGQKNPLALQLMAQGLYNHSTVACDEDDMPMSN